MSPAGGSQPLVDLWSNSRYPANGRSYPGGRRRLVDGREIQRCAALSGGLPFAFRGRLFSRPLVVRGRRSVIHKILPTDPMAAQLIDAAGLRDACDLDLLLFFSRHPRVVLSSEQLAAYVGYELAQVARALDRLLETGLLRRTLNQGAPGRMYVLEVDSATGVARTSPASVCDAGWTERAEGAAEAATIAERRLEQPWLFRRTVVVTSGRRP